MTDDALMDSAAVCALLGVQRNALARYRGAGLPFVVLAPGVYGDLRAAQAVAGHQNIQTTVSVYGKDADEARKRAAAAMDEVMRMEAK